MITYNKLIRDKIPTIIEKDNKTCVIEILDDDTFVVELKRKLIEEAKELSNAGSRDELINELADIGEIFDTIKQTYDISDSEVLEKQKRKAETNGKFEKRLFLVSVTKNDE